MNTYILLLRGINVGGKNKVPMADLRKCLEELGFSDVSTYIASGNIILKSDKRGRSIPLFTPREGVDRVWPGAGVIYSQRLSAQRTRSRLGKIVGTPACKSMTIRSWNTTTNY